MLTAGLCCLALFGAGNAPAEATLAERLAPLLKAHKGESAVAVKNLQTGETYYSNAEKLMPAAGLMTIAVMIEAYQQADAGKINLADTLRLRDEDKVPGSGVLAPYFSAGTTFSLRDAIRLMIQANDNTATKLVLDRVGVAAVNQRLKDWGLSQTRLHDKPLGDKPSLGSTTAREMIVLLEGLQVSSRNRPAIKQALLNHLRQNADKERLTRDLPEGVAVAHKDGVAPGVRNTAGILYAPGGAVAVCVLTCGNADRREHPDNAGNLFCAHVARVVYDHYSTPKIDKQP